jgi:hypothetical protein
MEPLYHPYWRHAGTFLGVALLLGATAALPWFLGWDERFALAILVVAAIVLLVSFGVAVTSWLTGRKLRRLQREERYLAWRYDETQWADYLVRERREARWAGVGVFAGLVFMGLVFATIAWFDDQLWFGSVIYTWLLPCGIGALAGGVGWALVRWNRMLVLRIMERVGGRFLLGPSGFYITGQFRPLDGVLQNLTYLDFQQGETPELVFNFLVDSGRYAEDQEVRVPVPPGQVAVVRQFLEKVGIEASAD